MAAAAPAYDGIRSIFFYNSEVLLGQSIGLHLFEPRYRIMIQRAMTEPSRQRQLIFLPNFREYIPAHGDIGFGATITRHRAIPSPGDELPRAEITMRFDTRIMVLFHWVEPNSSGLHECTFKQLPDSPPPLGDVEQLRDSLQTSCDGRYTVTAQNGFLNVHEEPSDPYSANVIHQLSDGDQVNFPHLWQLWHAWGGSRSGWLVAPSCSRV